MLKLTLTLLLAANFSLSLCGEGCLKCDSQNNCLFCDFTRSYVLRLGSCVFSSIPNCETQNLDGTCATCQPQHYLNPYTALCAAVPEVLRLSNCLRYQSLTTCAVCNGAFYTLSGKCVAVSSEIGNCSVYAGERTCAKCESGYVLSLDRTSCIKTPTVEKCAAFSSITCSKCRAGFLRNPNYFVNQMYKDYSPVSIAMSTKAIAAYIKGDVDRSTPQCELITVENCEILETASTCRQCASGYYRNLAGQCSSNPTQGVPNCGNYRNSTFCASCKWGYHLNANGTCSGSVSIQFCQEYDPSALETTCTLCSPGYYLFGYNNCIRRTFFANINLCEQYSPTLERCVACVANYQPTDDGLVCLEKIANCAAYISSTKADRHLRCATCAPGFYYDSSVRVCRPGSVKNCQILQPTTNSCAQCVNGYYLANGTCAPHRSLKFCAVYSPLLKDSCDVCHFESLRFTVSNFCYADNHIANCRTQVDNGVCTLCEDGYFIDTLSAVTRCVQIPAELNCLQYNNGASQCTRCVNGFSLISGKCYLPQEYQYKNCKVHNLSGSSNDITSFTCSQCVENTVPMELEKSFKCIERKTFTELIHGALTIDPNCSSFDYDEGLNTKVCVSCMNGKVLADGVCVDACVKFSHSTLYTHQIVFYNLKMFELQDSITVEKVNVCGPTIPNCAVAAPVLAQNYIELRYACIQCDPGFQKVVPIQKEFNAVVRISNDAKMFGETHLVPAVECKKIDSLLLLGLQTRSELISMCEYYQDIFLGVTACRKCQIGSNSIVFQISKNCILTEEFSPSCVTCAPGFHPVLIGSVQQCAEIEPIANCVAYDQSSTATICRQCLDDYFLDMGGCRLRNQSFRATNCVLALNADVCTCATGMYLQSANNCQPLPQNCLYNPDLAAPTTCATCDPTVSYLDGTSCKLGSISNCVEYDTVLPNTCVQCKNGFYVSASGSACVAHNPPAGSLCSVWNTFTENGCDKCPINHFIFHVKNLCMPANPIANCLTHATQTVCSVCADGYYLANRGSRCLEIPESMNCLKAEPKKAVSNAGNLGQGDTGQDSHQWYYDCVLCKPGYVTVVDTINDPSGLQYIVTRCSQSFQWMRDTCAAPAAHVVGSTLAFADTKYFCSGCKDGFQPAAFTGKRVCLTRPAIKDLFNNVADTLNEDCIAFNDAGVCTECVFPKGLPLPTTVCAEPVIGALTNESLRLGKLTKVDTNFFTWNPTRFIVSAPTVTKCYMETPLITPGSLPADGADHVYVCAKCVSGFLPVVTIADEYTIHPYGATSDAISAYANIFTPVSQCVASIKDFSGMNDLTGGIVNCKYYYIIEAGTPKYGCIRCNHGYTGPIYQALEAENGYIAYCEEMSACDKNTVYSGLMNPISNKEKIDQFFSCHKCTAADQFPVAFVAAGTSNTDVSKVYTSARALLGYRKTRVLDVGATTFSKFENDSVDRGRAVECLSLATLTALPSATPAGYGVTTATAGVLVPNCAMYFFNVQTSGDSTKSNDKTSSINPANTAMWCAACLPGFAPTYGDSSVASTKHFVVECTAFTAPACASPVGTTLNSCESGVFKYDYSTDRIKLSELISSDSIKLAGNRGPCLSADIMGNCRVCKAGYTLMRDGLCVLDIVSGCDRTAMAPLFGANYAMYLNINVFFTLSADTNRQGCAKCSAGFLPAIMPTSVTYDTNICIDYGAEPTAAAFYTPSGPFDVNPLINSASNHLSSAPSLCAVFSGIGNARKCRTCTAAGAMVSDGTNQWCVDATLVDVGSNCQQASSTPNIVGIYATCLTCATGYVNVGGLCYATSPVTSPRLRTTCKVHPDVPTAFRGDCTTCDDGYAKDAINLVCIPLTIQGCAQGTATVCSTCMKNYTQLSITVAGAPKVVCIPISNPGATEPWSYDPNCDTFDHTGTALRNLACTKCKSNYYLYSSITKPVLHDYCQPYNGLFTVANCAQYHESAVFGPSSYLCMACEQGYYKPPNMNICLPYSQEMPQCDTRTPEWNECASCVSNFAVNHTRTGCYNITSDPRPGFLGFCTEMSDCTKVQWKGLPLELASVLSCHVCKETGKIPFAFVNAGTIELRAGLAYGAYSSSVGAGKAYALGESDQNVRCLAPTATTFGISGTFNFPANCGVGLVNINLPPSAAESSQPASPTPAGSSVFCGACLPKFAPTFAKNAQDKQISNIVVGCTAIANCDFSQTFNSCELCQKGYVFGFNHTRGVLYDTCIPAPENPNCYAMFTEAGNNICKTCKKGFVKNRDGFCEALASPKCEANSFNYREYFEAPLTARGIATGHWGSGCRTCQKGFVGIRSSVPRFICAESPVVASSELPINTNYIPNCQNYVLDGSGEFKCAVCKSGFVLNVHKKCVPQSTMLGCQMFFGNKCENCGQNTAIFNRTCATAPGIVGCATYAPGRGQWEPVCTTCLPGFFLEGNLCLKSPVLRCDLHANEKLCNRCAKDYLPLLGRNETNYCIPVDRSLNCDSFDLLSLQSKEIKCNTCRPGFVKTRSLTDGPVTHCQQFEPIESCSSYEQAFSVANSTFACASCSGMSFLSEKVCRRRRLFFDTCLTYSTSDDRCMNCREGYYLSQDRKTCIAFPTGIEGCKTYSSMTSCKVCETGYYVYLGECIAIPTSSQVTNCLVHLSAGICDVCREGYVQKTGVCVAVVATNCDSYESPFACKTCKSGFKLLRDAEMVNCVAQTDPQCAINSEVTPYPCLQCMPGYFISNGVCTVVSTPITNCSVYDSETLCARCEIGYILSTDGRTCVISSSDANYSDPLCLDSKLVDTPVCGMCAPGHYFADNVCVSCAAASGNYGCAACNPLNPNTCYFCHSGYTMSSNGQCISNASMSATTASFATFMASLTA